MYTPKVFARSCVILYISTKSLKNCTTDQVLFCSPVTKTCTSTRVQGSILVRTRIPYVVGAVWQKKLYPYLLVYSIAFLEQFCILHISFIRILAYKYMSIGSIIFFIFTVMCPPQLFLFFYYSILCYLPIFLFKTTLPSQNKLSMTGLSCLSVVLSLVVNAFTFYFYNLFCVKIRSQHLNYVNFL